MFGSGSKNGWTATMLAAWEGHDKALKLLIDGKADLNVAETVVGGKAVVSQNQ